ncbi:hypothetical protein SO802_013990 [Lithocarpus litseifolius]|uniref:Disease resistance protein RGA3 n=1 Tax=Lithocarpus litseifolius TaxID=425828 RepID=A0AAW2D9Y6_9ROSI
MAERMIYDLLKQLASVIARETQQEIQLVTGVKKAVQKLEGNLRTVKAVLNDAEKKQFKDEAVKLWLQKLGDACYEMDDVVDEWNTAMIKSEILEQDNETTAVDNAPSILRRKVCLFIPSPSCCFRQVGKVVLNHDISHKIKELNEKLDEITKEKERYGLELTGGSSSEERPITTFLVDELEILGRDKVRDDLVSSLLDEGTISDKAERNPHVISLVGMGGIGKTTLAQLAYNHPNVQAHFGKRIWVCVSEPFDQCRVANEIIEAFDDRCPKIIGFPNLMAKICELIPKSDKVLLVFDDVWIEESNLWDPFKIALQKGALGSRILVTTRKSRVAEIMKSVRTINLGIVSEEDCWLIFSKIAFLDRDPKQYRQLEDLARQISNKCKGLPLAAKTLGSLMRFKRSREQWEMVLSSNLWEFEDVERGLFAPLLLSYYDLPSPLKRCFSYCAIFPKDFVFSSDELVLMWMAQGYIDSKENTEMEVIAREYFENLAIRSFFQDFKKEEHDDRIMRCKMHDIVHDFAQLLTKNECFIVNSDRMQGSNYKNARHLQLKIPKNAQFPESIYGANNLRTLIFEFQGDYNLPTLFQHFRCLRALTLNCEYDFRFNATSYMFKELPDVVENFIHLRYLNLVNYCGDGLPETIYNLCNLQILNIQIGGEEFRKLPQGMNECEAINAQLKKKINLHTLKLMFYEWDGEEMIREKDALVLNALEPAPNLEHLHIVSCKAPIMFPNWMMSLTNLKKLRINGLSIERLPPLGKLRFLESLDIWNMNRVKKVGVEFMGIEESEKKEKGDIIITVFPNLISLDFIGLYNWEDWNGIGGEEEEECNRFTIMPRLQHLTIWRCRKLRSLPNFLRTTTLQKLEIL